MATSFLCRVHPTERDVEPQRSPAATHQTLQNLFLLCNFSVWLIKFLYLVVAYKIHPDFKYYASNEKSINIEVSNK